MIAPLLCPALGRFEKLWKRRNPSVFSTLAVCIAATKQNGPTNLEKEFKMWLNHYETWTRPEAAVMQSFC